MAKPPKEEHPKGKTLWVVEIGVLRRAFRAAGVWGLWSMIAAAEVVGEKDQEG